MMNTPSIQVSLEHGAWFGNLIGVPRSVQKKFVELMVDAHCDLSIGESIQHIYTTLGILQQALYAIIDENASPKLGTWKKQGLDIIPENPGTWTVTKSQLNDAFSMLFYQIQDAWQCSSAETCKQIMEAYKDKTGTKPYPVTLMRQTDKDACINFFIKDTAKPNPSNLSCTPAEAKRYVRDNPNNSIMSVPRRLCHWLFPETRVAQTAVYARDISYQTHDEVKYLSEVREEAQLASPFCQKHLQYNCGRCQLCRKVWRARIKREIRHNKRHGGRAVWIQRDKSRYGPQHKELSELEKCINLLVTKWQRQDGITPSQPPSSPFHTCPVCSYKVPTSVVTQDNEEVRAYTATFDNLAQQLTEEDRKRQMKGFENNDKNPKVPPYVRPVQVCTDMIEGDWHSAQDVLLSDEPCQHEGKVWTGRTIFGGRCLHDDNDASSDEEAKNPRSRKVHFSSQDDDEEKDWVKDVVTTGHKDTVESQSLNKTNHHDDEEEKTANENKGTTKQQVLEQLYAVD